MKFLSTLFLSAWMGMAFSLSAADALQVSAEPVSGNITFWKGYRRFFHSIYGSPNNLIIGFNVPALETKYELKNPTFSMSVPPGVKLEEVLAHYISPRSGQAVIYPLPMNTERQADGSLVCTFSEMKDFLEMNRQYSGSMRCKELTFYFEPENFDPSREYTLIYRCTNGNELASENHVILKFLPPIAETKLPKNFRFRNMVNRLWHLNVKDPDLQQRIMKKYEASGMASSGCLNREWDPYEPVLRKAGWLFTQMLLWEPREWRREWCDSPIKAVLLPNGKEDPQYHCPTAALQNRELMSAVAKRNFEYEHIVDGDVLVIDTEPFGYIKHHACFCPECLAEFTRQYKTDPVSSLTPQQVQEKYAAPWLDFNVKLYGKMLESRISEFRRRFPHSKVTIYEYMMDFDQPERLASQLYNCPLDPQEADRFVDYHVPSIYTYNGKEAIARIRNQKKYLTKPVGASISTDRALGMFSGYLSSSQASSPAGIRMKILLVAALGGPEVQNYCGRYHHDGYVFVNVAKALGEIAVLEDFYAEQKESTVAKASIESSWNRKYSDEFLTDSFEFIAKNRQEDTLLTLFNFGREFPIETVAEYSGNLKSFYVSDPVRKIRYTCQEKSLWTPEMFANSFRIRLFPEDAAFILLSQTDPLLGSENITTSDLQASVLVSGETTELESSIADEKQLMQEQLSQPFSNRRHQSSSIVYTDNGMIVTTPSQEIHISYASGLITGWKNLQTGKVLLPVFQPARYSYGEGAAWMIVNSPARYKRFFEQSHLRFNPCDVTILDEGDAVIRLGFLASDFALRKSFEISATAPEIKLTLDFKNLCAGVMKTSLQARICFPFPDIRFLVDGKEIALKTFNNYLLPGWDTGTAKQFVGNNSSAVVGIFNLPVASAILPGGGLAVDWGMRDVSKLLFYRDNSISTLELLTVEKDILPLRSFLFKTQMKAQ